MAETLLKSEGVELSLLGYLKVEELNQISAHPEGAPFSLFMALVLN